MKLKLSKTQWEKIGNKTGWIKKVKKSEIELKQKMMQFLCNKWDKLVENCEDEAEVAIYWFANHYHEGQNSELYSILSTSPFKPGMLSKFENEDEIVQDMYADLEENFK